MDLLSPGEPNPTAGGLQEFRAELVTAAQRLFAHRQKPWWRRPFSYVRFRFDSWRRVRGYRRGPTC